MNTGIFTEAENAYLLNNYPKKTQAEIAQVLNRKVEAVKDRIKKLGLSKVPKQKWSKEEEALLKKIWHRENNYMKYFPNRTRSSVMYKAFGLGLKRDGRGAFDVDHNFFKVIDGRKAYILGLIMADGNIYKKVFRICLKKFNFYLILKDLSLNEKQVLAILL